MMQAAKEGLMEGVQERGGSEIPMLIAVTQLTSTDEEMMHQELLVNGEMEDVVVHYAENARKAGLDGVVCSAWESPMIHERVASDFRTITPRIRLAGDAKGDQSRVATPAKAKALGSDYLVIGRSITKAADPVAAYARCKEDMGNE